MVDLSSIKEKQNRKKKKQILSRPTGEIVIGTKRTETLLF